MKLQPIPKDLATHFVQGRHYSAVMPRLTKHFLGSFVDNNLVGVITFGWGTRPLHTIQKLFPTLATEDYFEIGKMCMDESMPRNSESQMLSAAVSWLKQHHKEKQYLFTWADGIVGKVGYVYQAANFYYGGSSVTEVYVTENGEKLHPRTMQSLLTPKSEDLKYGSRPDFEVRKQMNISHVWGKQYRYIYPLNKKARKMLSESTVEWSLNHPKDNDLEWWIQAPGEKERVHTTHMPFKYTGAIEVQKKIVDKYTQTNTLEHLFQ